MSDNYPDGIRNYDHHPSSPFYEPDCCEECGEELEECCCVDTCEVCLQEECECGRQADGTYTEAE